MVPIYHCGVCRTKVLETRLKKHHAKVHPTASYDIYTNLTNYAASEQPSNNHNFEMALEIPKRSEPVWNVEPPNDPDMIHIECNICHNKMTAMALEAHMKRKHAGDAGDQVDAIGVMGGEMSFDTVERHALAGQLKSANFLANQFMTEHFKDQSKPMPLEPFNPAKNNVEYGRNFKPFAKTTQLVPSEKSKDDTIFYSIRITEDQMQHFLNENRIQAKDGTFYLK